MDLNELEHYIESYTAVSEPQLQDYFTPYDRLESELVPHLSQRSQLDHETHRATTASAIQLIESARALPIHFSLRQVFNRYPIQTSEGQTLFQLITQLCHITDRQAQQAFIHECFACASWMKDIKRRDQFLSTTSTWGLSLANRFFSSVSTTSTHESLNAEISITQRFARRFGSPIMHKTIMQAVSRLTDPLIYADTLANVLKKSNQPLHLRPGLPYGVTLKQAEANKTAYLQIITELGQAWSTRAADKITLLQSSVHIELHHFTGPFDIRQEARVRFLLKILQPLVSQAKTLNIRIILSSTLPFSNPLLRHLLVGLLPLAIPTSGKYSLLGVELSAAEPSSLASVNALQFLAKNLDVIIPTRLTKERSKPSLANSAAIHASYIALAQFCLQPNSNLLPLFVSHNIYTLACIHHLGEKLQHHDFEIHHRSGIGQRCQIAFKTLHKGIIRLEAPFGAKHNHHHMILQRLREFTDPNAFMNKLYNDTTTTASLVNHPSVQLKRILVNQIDFWRQQKVKPHQIHCTSIDYHSKTPETIYADAKIKLNDNRPIIVHSSHDLLEANWALLEQAHQNCIAQASLWVKLCIDHMDIPRHIAELQVEAALQQQERFLRKPFKQINATSRRFPRGKILFISSSQRPLSPLLEQITRALLFGNSVLIKPATATLTLIEQVLQSFWQAGLTLEQCDCLPVSHETLQKLLAQNQALDSVIFDGLQTHAQALASITLNNHKQPPIAFWSTPASSCMSTQGMCLIDETASDQELYNLTAEAWKMGPMIILVASSMLNKVEQAFNSWRQTLIIGSADNRDTSLSLTQALQPFPINLAPICIDAGIATSISIPAPQQQQPFFQLLEFNDSNLLTILQALSKDAQVNRFTLLTRMPVRIKNILNALPAHEIHLGWPRDHSSFVFPGLENSVYQLTTHILRHQRLHPWTNDGTFDITDV